LFLYWNASRFTGRLERSGLDMLYQEIQQFDMGPVEGIHTWGGAVNVSMFIPLIEGDSHTAPHSGKCDAAWIIS